MIRKDRVKGKGTTGNQIPEKLGKSRGNDYRGKERKTKGKERRGDTLSFKQK